MADSDENIQSGISGKIGRLLINRPGSHNALSRKMWLSIPAHLDSLRASGANLIIIEGTGQSFAAGADLLELKDLDNLDDAQSNWAAIADTLDYVYNFQVPTIAAVDGACLGGGCLLAASCDLRYASRRSQFSVPIARLGIVLDDANLGRLASLLGAQRAKELIFRALVLDADTAFSWGLLNDVFPDAEFEKQISAICSEILSNSPLSISEAKSSFARYVRLTSNADNERMVISSYLEPEFKRRVERALRKD